MTAYAAPLQDMRFVLTRLVGLERLAALPGWGEVTTELVDAVLEEAGKLAGDVVAPLNAVGDREGAVLENGVVRTPAGFREAYRQYREGGWNGLPFDPAHGGQGLPWVVGMAVQEMWHAANMGFALCPLLNQAAVEVLQAHGTPEQQALYLPRLVSGDWTGTMNLTEPQAGSDLGLIRTRAARDGDAWRIQGQKIFITYGEHDLAENIVHLVLARTPAGPPGIRGLSLFLVPKFLPDTEGRPGRRNDLRCVKLEHKLGIHASPTCVMAYGDAEGARGWLVGEENRGIEAMFTMMNNARLAVGLQGVAIAERAVQQARAYAGSRLQGRGAAGEPSPVPILRHPDVRRMLLSMKAQTEAGRALVYTAAVALDLARRHPDPAQRAAAQARVDLLTPVAKGWCTDMAVEVASLGVQVHGGMGFIEETGAAQLYRDARILPIYEGTNGIQAVDLAFRKVARDEGRTASALLDEMRALDSPLGAAPGEDMAAIRAGLAEGVKALAEATEWVVATTPGNPAAVAAGAAPYLDLFGTAAGGFLMARAALAADAADGPLAAAKRATARFYAAHLLSRARGLLLTITEGHHAVVDHGGEAI